MRWSSCVLCACDMRACGWKRHHRLPRTRQRETLRGPCNAQCGQSPQAHRSGALARRCRLAAAVASLASAAEGEATSAVTATRRRVPVCADSGGARAPRAHERGARMRCIGNALPRDAWRTRCMLYCCVLHVAPSHNRSPRVTCAVQSHSGWTVVWRGAARGCVGGGEVRCPSPHAGFHSILQRT